MKGIVSKSTGSWYQVRVKDGNIVSARLPGKFKLEDKKITNPIAVGDRVEIEHSEENGYMISRIEDRDNYIIRNSPRKRGHAHLLATNVDQAILVASFKQPKTSTGFIDRFFVTLETFRIPGLLLVNKLDLYDSDEIAQIGELCQLYESIGYATKITSLQDAGASDVLSWFSGKTTLLSGHSGSGKSTLINALIPAAEQQVSAISGFANKGVHTTTFAEMFAVDPRSFVIDSPGIKELGLAEVDPEELCHYFPEMRSKLGQCKFNNCMHVNEPGCVIIHAVEEGEIHVSRYYSYLSMIANDDNRR